MRHLHSMSVVTQLIRPVHNMLVPIIALLHVDDTEFCVFNEGGDVTEEIVSKAQFLLNTRHAFLMMTGSELK